MVTRRGALATLFGLPFVGAVKLPPSVAAEPIAAPIAVTVEPMALSADEAWIREVVTPAILDAINNSGQNFNNFDALVKSAKP